MVVLAALTLRDGSVPGTQVAFADSGAPTSITATYNSGTGVLMVSGTYTWSGCPTTTKAVGFAIFINGANPVTPGSGALDGSGSINTMHPANIRGVRVRLTVRSLLKDLAAGAGFAGDPAVPPGQTSIENRNNFTAVTLGQLRRYFSSVAVATPNLNSKDPFIF